MGVGHWLRVVLWDSTWANNVAWIEALLIAFVCGYFFRDKIGKKLAKWWNIKVVPNVRNDIHDKVDDLRQVIDRINDHIHNGMLNDLHDHIDQLIAERPVQPATVNVRIENEIEEPVVIVDETQPAED